MDEVLKVAWELSKPLFALVATAAAGVAVAYLNSLKRQLDRQHQEVMTEYAVEATDQTMPNASGADKLAATKKKLGRLANETMIESIVKNKG